MRVSGLDLPQLDENQQAHLEKMMAHLESRMKNKPMPFDVFMEEVLYAPGLGYYSAGQSRFGKTGDFTTAADESVLFADTLARVFAGSLHKEDDIIVEIGPGRGRFTARVLIELEKLSALPASYCLLERSAGLKQEQARELQEKCPHLLDRVQWIDEPPGQDFTGIVFANEVLDALPVKRLQWLDGVVSEYCVTLREGALTWSTQAADEHLSQHFASLLESCGSIPEPGQMYVSELCPQRPAWLNAILKNLKNGKAIFIDYGYRRCEYFHPQRSMGSLMCHYRHRAHENPLLYPGLQDITAFVDFDEVAEKLVAMGFEVEYLGTQGEYLLSSGLLELLSDDPEKDLAGHWQKAREVKRLTLPGEMGEAFKVLVASC